MLGVFAVCAISTRRCFVNVCISVLFHKRVMHVCVPVSVAALEFLNLLSFIFFCACLWVQSKASPVLLWATAEVWNSLLTSNTHSGTLRTALIFLTPKPRLCLGRTLKCQSDYKQDKPPSRACENTPAHNHFHWGDLWLCFLWHWRGFDGKLC